MKTLVTLLQLKRALRKIIAMNSEHKYEPTLPQDADRTVPFESVEEYHTLTQLGYVLFDKYKIFAKKEGGFGVVLFVVDIFTDQKYAVKTYNPYVTNETQFKEEASVWINLGFHPNIVGAHFVKYAGKTPFLFLEYVSGIVLRDLIGKLTVSQAVNYAYQICQGMKFLYQGRHLIVHGDLKPENILVTPDNIVKLTDFGLSGHFSLNFGELLRHFSGTCPYMAYEQISSGLLDERSDIFSFGVMFFEMLSGY